MPHVQVSPQAEQDLIEIWLFIAEGSPENADRFLDRLADAAERVAEFRDMGRARPELADDMKSFPLGRYVLFYRDCADGIELVRVLRASRDIDVLF